MPLDSVDDLTDAHIAALCGAPLPVTIRRPLAADPSKTLTLYAELCPLYPSVPPVVSVYWDGGRNDDVADANAFVSARAEALRGGLSLAELLQDAQDRADAAEERRAAAAGRESGGGAEEAGEGAFMRGVVWFHHIVSPTKRREAAAWAKELSLTGVLRVGYPGAIIVEVGGGGGGSAAEAAGGGGGGEGVCGAAAWAAVEGHGGASDGEI